MRISSLAALASTFMLGATLTAQAPAPTPAQAAQTPAPAPPSTPAPASPQIEENVSYATINGAELDLDIYHPATPVTEPRPAVILIHGGSWSALDKSTMRSMGRFLAASGFVAFSVDYRLFSAGDKKAPNRWPAQLDDVQRAVRWIRANAAKYGVDPSHIGAFGHSAGAQLAALLGMEDTRDNSDRGLAKYSSRVQAVVDVSGPTDFTLGGNSDGAQFFTNLFGVPYESRPDIWREASPVFHVSRKNSPFLIVHGTEDSTVPIDEAEELYAKLQAAGVPVSFVKVKDGHTFQTPEARLRLATETQAFFNRYLLTAK